MEQVRKCFEKLIEYTYTPLQYLILLRKFLIFENVFQIQITHYTPRKVGRVRYFYILGLLYRTFVEYIVGGINNKLICT